MELTISKQRYYDMINNIVNFDKLSHAYIIEIDDYESDFSCVIDFVKLILTKDIVDNNIVDLVDSGNYPDLKIIEPEGSFIKKAQLLKLQEEFRNKSFLNNKMIYVIKEADKLNDSSGNTILKFLEEPAEDIVAILVTTSRYKIIETILSRCQILSVHNSIVEEFSEKSIDFIKFVVNGDDLFINYQFIFDNILTDKDVAKNFLLSIEVILIKYLNYLSNKEENVCNKNVIGILSRIDEKKIINFISVIEEEVQKLNYNVNYKLWLDCLFSRLIGG